MLYYLNTVFLNQGSAGCLEEFHDKLWNIYIYILRDMKYYFTRLQYGRNVGKHLITSGFYIYHLM